MSSVRVFAAGRPGPIKEITGGSIPPDLSDPLLWADVEPMANVDEVDEAIDALVKLSLREFSPALLASLEQGDVVVLSKEGPVDPAVKQLTEGSRLRLLAAADASPYHDSGGRLRATPRPVHLLAGPGWLLTLRPLEPAMPHLTIETLVAHVRSVGWPAGKAGPVGFVFPGTVFSHWLMERRASPTGHRTADGRGRPSLH